jgi:hypothetical protein
VSLQHSLLFSAGFSAAAAVARVASVAATLFGSDFEEPPQHELDMIDLLKLKLLRMPIIYIWMFLTVIQDATHWCAGPVSTLCRLQRT